MSSETISDSLTVVVGSAGVGHSGPRNRGCAAFVHMEIQHDATERAWSSPVIRQSVWLRISIESGLTFVEAFKSPRCGLQPCLYTFWSKTA